MIMVPILLVKPKAIPSPPPNLTVNSISTKGIATMDTIVQATLKVTSPATESKHSKDGTPIINIKVEFTDPDQTQLTKT